MFTFAYWLTRKLFWLAQFLPGSLFRAWLCTPRGFKYALLATLLVVPYALFGLWLYFAIRAGDAPRSLLPVVIGCGIAIYWHLAIAYAVLEARAEAKIIAAREARREERARTRTPQ